MAFLIAQSPLKKSHNLHFLIAPYQKAWFMYSVYNVHLYIVPRRVNIFLALCFFHLFKTIPNRLVMVYTTLVHVCKSVNYMYSTSLTCFLLLSSSIPFSLTPIHSDHLYTILQLVFQVYQGLEKLRFINQTVKIDTFI